MNAQRRRLLGACEVVFGMGIAAYWASYFFAPPNEHARLLISAEHAAFEAAFPAADALLTAALFAAGICLWRGSRWGDLLSGMCGGALIFLGILDASFNVQNRVYTYGTFLAVLNVTINVLCIGFGFCLVRYVRKMVILPES